MVNVRYENSCRKEIVMNILYILCSFIYIARVFFVVLITSFMCLDNESIALAECGPHTYKRDRGNKLIFIILERIKFSTKSD